MAIILDEAGGFLLDEAGNDIFDEAGAPPVVNTNNPWLAVFTGAI